MKDDGPEGGNTGTCRVVDLGRIGYGESVALQEKLVRARKDGTVPDVLLLCEHPPVITMGRNAKAGHLLISEAALRERGVELHATNRGGDVTYHGPGQLVAYPILNLAGIRRDVGWYVRQLEEAMIRASVPFGVNALRVPGKTGVWVRPDQGGASAAKEEKLGAIGVHLSRWVTSHGLAYNVCTDLRYFDLIVPCGIADCRATSLEKLVGRHIALGEPLAGFLSGFGEAMGLRMESSSREELEQWIADPQTRPATSADAPLGRA